MCSASTSCVMSSRFLRATADDRVQHYRREENRALKRVGPVAVPLCIDDPDLHHAEHRRAEEGADHRAEASREQAAADDRADDEDELEPDPLLRLHRAKLECLD